MVAGRCRLGKRQHPSPAAANTALLATPTQVRHGEKWMQMQQAAMTALLRCRWLFFANWWTEKHRLPVAVVAKVQGQRRWKACRRKTQKIGVGCVPLTAVARRFYAGINAQMKHICAH